MVEPLKIGILFSTSGPYGSMGKDARDGAEFAIAGLSETTGRKIEPVFYDPRGNLADYLEGARYLLRQANCRHVIGTITSAARKEVIPLVEKHDGLLWYMCPWEGFEANENVIYLGGCPNQHLIPLFEHLIPRFGVRPYLVGANYVWGWEMNRLARELISANGGEILGEKYLPLEDFSVDRVIADIELRRPSFVLNNLIGPASYAFLAAMTELAQRDPAFSPERCPVVSCDLMECELGDIEAGAAIGQLCAASYFDALPTPENQIFKAAIADWQKGQRRVSSLFAGAYTAVNLCVGAVLAADSDEPGLVRDQLVKATWSTVFGPLDIDRHTNHAALPFHLGRINPDNGFDVIASRPPVAADPYLIAHNTRMPSRLRVVS